MTREGDRIELLAPTGTVKMGARGTVYQTSESGGIFVRWDGGEVSWLKPRTARWRVLVRLPIKDMTQEHPAPPEEE